MFTLRLCPVIITEIMFLNYVSLVRDDELTQLYRFFSILRSMFIENYENFSIYFYFECKQIRI